MKKSRWSSWMSSIVSLKSKVSGASAQQKKPRTLRSRSLQLEPLEQRQMLSITVNSWASGSDSDPETTTLYEAIYQANQTTGADTITFDGDAFPLSQPYTINLGGNAFSITDDLTINGFGEDWLTLDAGDSSRVFNVASNVTATLSGMTITGGSTTNDGGGIFGNTGSDITIEDAVITANSADRGGGVFTLGSLSVDNVDFTYNTATGTLGFGGGLSGGGGSIVNIVDSWFYQNDADSYGGGMFFSNSKPTLMAQRLRTILQPMALVFTQKIRAMLKWTTPHSPGTLRPIREAESIFTMQRWMSQTLISWKTKPRMLVVGFYADPRLLTFLLDQVSRIMKHLVVAVVFG